MRGVEGDVEVRHHETGCRLLITSLHIACG